MLTNPIVVESHSPVHRNSLFRVSLYLVAIFYLFGPILHTLKLFRLDTYDLGPVFFYVFLLVVPILMATAVFLYMISGVIYIPPLGLVVLLITIWGILPTVFYGGTEADIAGNFLRLGLSVSASIMAYIYCKEVWFVKTILHIAIFGFIGVLLGGVIMYVGVFSGRPVYLGLVTHYAIPALCYSLSGSKSNKIISILIFAVILLGGKRGVILAAVAVVFVSFFFLKRGRGVVKVLWFLLLIAIGVMSVAFFNPETVSSLPRPIAQRIEPFIGSSRVGGDLRHMTSARNLEVEAVIDVWHDNPSALITGMGLGGTFTEYSGEQDNTIHISPVAVTYLLGLPSSILLYGSLAYVVVRLIRRFRFYDQDRMFKYHLLCIIGFVMVAMSSYEIFQNAMLWISIGAASKYR